MLRRLIAVTILAVSPADAQAPAWEGLAAGPHVAGFRVLRDWDRGRTRFAPTDFAGRRAGGDPAVPRQLAVWYPAVEVPRAIPMTLLDLRLVAIDDAENGRVDEFDRFRMPTAADTAAAIADAVRGMNRL